ncbi:MFS transporter [Microbacterium sp. zg-Y818]|uniref:MFS transporter n=1 Tax=unclassified Microbacterium TaxID=2609290 RepID=UPI00214C6211|nr:MULTISPECIES: MFS transporter [unclassified Microbacterium]MCR2799550.1 MFS transporter [Microbacterium sp. zg.Y818]WIM21544.1 MFS transporter [Microbacterium sp. zg-Y818]
MAAAFLAFYDRALLAPMITAAARDLHADPPEIAQAVTVYVLTYAATQVPWAAVSGRLGQLPTLSIAAGIASAGALLSGLAWDAASLTVARALSGAALAAIVPTILVHIGDTMQLHRRAVAAVNLATALSLGMTVGSALSAALAEWWTWRVAFFSSALVAVVVCVVFALAGRGGRGVPVAFWSSFPRLARNPWVPVVLVLAVVEGTVLVGVINFIPVALEADGVPVSIAGFALAAFGIAVVGWSFVVRRLVRQLPAWALLAVGGLAAVAAFAVLWATRGVGTAIVAVVLLGFAWSCAHTQLQTWATDVVMGARPLGMALFAVALFGGGVLGSALGVWAVARSDYAALFAVAFAVALIFTLAASLLRVRYIPRETE